MMTMMPDPARYEEMVFQEGRRRGREEATKELMAWHDRVCEEMAKHHMRHMMLNDGTLVVSVADATAVTRVLVEDEHKNGNLYYADRPQGEWIDKGDRYWYCSECGIADTDKWHWCHGCGAEMKGADDE